MSDTPIIDRSFASWRQSELAKTFRLNRVRRMPELLHWLEQPQDVSPATLERLNVLQDFADECIDAWNEEELKMHLLAPLISMVDLRSSQTGFFVDRPLEAVIDNIRLHGRPDGVFATGNLDPEVPYFCLHEYKREQGKDTDPRGQLLSAMLAAQHLNQDKHPIRGAYVLGRFWFFALLKDKEYSFSHDFSSGRELVDIYRVLLSLKQNILSDQRLATT